MDVLFLIGLVAGGFIVCLLVAGLLFSLPFARSYFGRRTMIIAALLPVLAYPFAPLFGALISALFQETSTFGLLGVLYLATAASVVFILPPLFEPKPDRRLRRPVIAALAIFAADAWNCYIFYQAADPCFMGACC